jgi:hypothetical protein
MSTQTPNNPPAVVERHATSPNSSLATRLSNPAVVKCLLVVLAIILVAIAGELCYYFVFLKTEARPAPIASRPSAITPIVTGNTTTLPAQTPRGIEATTQANANATMQDQAQADVQATTVANVQAPAQANTQATTGVTEQKLPLYLLSSPSLAGNFYTASSAERDKAISDGYQYKGVVGYVLSTQVAGSTPLYLLSNPKTGDHFYTTSATDRAHVISGGYYQDDGVVGYVFSTQVADSTPLYQLFILKVGYHFYTMSASERDTATARDDYEYGGIVCYILPA